MEHSAYMDLWTRRRILTPSGRPGIVTGWVVDRLNIKFTDKASGTVILHPNLIEVIDGRPRPAK